MERKDDSQADRFWQEKENEYGGNIFYKTFTRFLGSLQGGKKDLSGLLYIVNGRLIFEDFEKDGGFLGMIFKRSNKPAFEKTTISIELSQITQITEISQGTASARLAGHPGPVKPISGLMKFFSITVNEIMIEDGNGYYFEVLDKSSLLETIEKETNI